MAASGPARSHGPPRRNAQHAPHAHAACDPEHLCGMHGCGAIAAHATAGTTATHRDGTRIVHGIEQRTASIVMPTAQA